MVEPRSNMYFVHILGQKEATWNTIFSIFERRRGPPNVAGPGKTFLSLLTGLHNAIKIHVLYLSAGQDADENRFERISVAEFREIFE